MKIQIQLYATLKLKAGSNSIEVELEGNEATVQQVINASLAKHPTLESSLRSILVAVNKEYASKDQLITPTDTVAFFPPVSGG